MNITKRIDRNTKPLRINTESHRCACVNSDPYTCSQMRYSGDVLFDEHGSIDELCECACHNEVDDDV